MNVGRFDPAGHSKRQDFIVDVFVAASPLIQGISLSLVGGLPVDPRKEAYVAALKKRASGYAVDFHLNATRSLLEAELSRASVYFHACGVGQNMVASPERQEHFGISVVEGMMAGLIPVVYDGGGPAEITVAAGVGFRYRTFGEAVAILQAIAAMGPEEIADMSRRATEFAHGFSDDHFRRRVRTIVADVMEAAHA